MRKELFPHVKREMERRMRERLDEEDERMNEGRTRMRIKGGERKDINQSSPNHMSLNHHKDHHPHHPHKNGGIIVQQQQNETRTKKRLNQSKRKKEGMIHQLFCS